MYYPDNSQYYQQRHRVPDKRTAHYTRKSSLANQLLRSGTSIGANIEEAIAGQSRKDFISKMSIALKEARETNYWLRLLRDSNIVSSSNIKPLINESEELIKILFKIVESTSKNN